jgi:peptide/nickel transport system permease protein
MSRYLARRLLQAVPTLLTIALLVFFMLDLVPGDPAILVLGREADADALRALRVQLGLELPLHERMLLWFGDLLRGDLGDSIFLRRPVVAILLDRYPVTVSMTVLSLLVAVAVGVPAGIIAAIKQGGLVDWMAMVLALVVLSIPIFWLGLALIYFFGVRLGWLPIGGYVPLREDPVEFLRHMILPCTVLGLAYAAMIARMTRTSMLEVLRTDYVRTAEAKGLHRLAVLLRHAFRNALVPIVTVTGLIVGELLGGSPITETVFNLPGVGRLVAEGVLRRDYIVVQGGILILAASYLLVNLVVDLLYVRIDPRIRYE